MKTVLIIMFILAWVTMLYVTPIIDKLRNKKSDD